MNKIQNIAVLGIGGVGGFYGGMLAKHYTDTGPYKITFIARGQNEKAIHENGLKLITENGEHFIKPNLVSSDASTIGKIDLLLCCVKSYHLDSAMESIKSCIDKNTIIIPFLNGVNATERIKNNFPNSDVWGGCVYIVSKLVSPGVVETKGKLNEMYFGSIENPDNTSLIRNIFTEAGINALATDNIVRTIWEKFIFLSPMATTTTYYDSNIGSILLDTEKKEVLVQLVKEVIDLARAKNIPVGEDVFQKTFTKIQSLPFDATSSMHRDFKSGSLFEVDTLTEYVVVEGKKYSLENANYQKPLRSLMKSED